MAKGGRKPDDKGREVREMRNAETILDITQNRGNRGLPLEDVYRQLYNPTLYLMAYGKLYRNAGAMTPGATTETVDGMSLETFFFIFLRLPPCPTLLPLRPPFQ